MNLGTINSNGKFIPNQDYVGNLKKLCKENDIITYSVKKLPKVHSYTCTVTVARLNSKGKPKQESSDDFCTSERMADSTS